jgi:hypothetical protein
VGKAQLGPTKDIAMPSTGLVLFLLLRTSSASASSDIKKSLNELKDQLEKESQADEKAHDKLGCWCQQNTASVKKVVDDAQSKSEELHHKIEELTARNSQFSIEIDSHQADIQSTQHSLDQAQSLREREASKFSDDETMHMSSVGSLDDALKALRKGHGHEMDLTLASLKKKLQKDPKANKLMLLVNKQLRGKQDPDAINGILKQMKGTFESNLESMRKDNEVSQKRYSDLVGAKQEMLKAQAAGLANKKRSAAQVSVELAEAKKRQESADRSQQADTTLLIAMQGLCKTEDEGFTARKMERQSEVTAIAEAQASIADMSANQLAVLATLSGIKRSPLSGDGPDKICAVANGKIDKKWRKKAQAACEDAKAGKAKEAAKKSNALKEEVDTAQKEAEDKSTKCEQSTQEARGDADLHSAEEERSKSAVRDMEAEISSVQEQTASNEKAKTDLLAAKEEQHAALQEMQFTCLSAAKLLRKASEKAKGSGAHAKLNEAMTHSETLASMAKEAQANTEKNVAAVLEAQKGSMKALSKALIPLKLAKARSEEDAINAKESHGEASSVGCDAAALRGQASELGDLSKDLGDASDALDFWA